MNDSGLFKDTAFCENRIQACCAIWLWMNKQALIPVERIQRVIFLLRGEKVMIDHDLAALYGVTTSNLNKAVKRNQDRFPSDFMFQLTPEEAANLMFQIGISSPKHGGRRSGALLE